MSKRLIRIVIIPCWVLCLVLFVHFQSYMAGYSLNEKPVLGGVLIFLAVFGLFCLFATAAISAEDDFGVMDNRMDNRRNWIIVIIGFLLSIVSCSRSCVDDTQGSEKRDIYSLRTSTELRGVFVLGTGTIGTEDYYVFYSKNKHGGLEREKVPTDKCIIYEGTETPHMIRYGYIEYQMRGKDTAGTEFKDPYRYYLYVPTGTITENVNMDFK